MLRSDGWPGTFFTPCNTPFSSSISLSFWPFGRWMKSGDLISWSNGFPFG
jgi:hypothetical protein